MLIYGPTGCGKSALVDWLAYQLHRTHKFLVLHCADLVHKVVGESESRLSSYFSRARALAPCLLVLDNIDIIFGSNSIDEFRPEGGGFRSHSNRSKHAALDRLLSTLLVELDGIPPESSAGAAISSRGDLIVIATASDKSLLDKALKRPGRLEEHFELGLPSYERRLEFFTQEVSKRSCRLSKDQANDVESKVGLFAELANRTAGFNYAQLHLMVQEASHKAVRARLREKSSEAAVDAFLGGLSNPK